MGSPWKIGKVEEETILDLKKRGWSHAEVATIVGIHRSSVSNVLKKFGAQGPRGRPTVMTPEAVAEAENRYRAGASVEQVAAAMNVSLSTAVRMLEGVEKRPSEGRPRSLSEDQVESAVAAYEAGTPVKAIAKRFGVSYRTIYRILKPRANPGFSAPIGLMVATSAAALAFGVWGWVKVHQ